MFTMQLLEAEQIPVLDWPAYSLDMLPNGMFVIDVSVIVFQFRITFLQLCVALEEEWNNIPQATTYNLVNDGHKILSGDFFQPAPTVST